MYTDDYSDKESEYEDRSPEESPSITKKCVSTAELAGAGAGARPLRATQSLTATEELRLCGTLQRINLCNRVSHLPTRPAPVCPCGCLLRRAAPAPFRTREQTTLALHVVPPEALTHHGYSYQPSQIAMFWKKDCRSFLWKGKAKMKNIIHADSHKK
ncbi:unnamed protein product [Plutella xylostella]|uniref:(diamondback moth) hypothetical protein n=1 Tax=Plutella xylostella TaxID=51655 RepID=A0A8S4DIH3_PLUXY|nr:unnamed protein product [Plutella xylostella]